MEIQQTEEHARNMEDLIRFMVSQMVDSGTEEEETHSRWGRWSATCWGSMVEIKNKTKYNNNNCAERPNL